MPSAAASWRSKILAFMEIAAIKTAKEYCRYGSNAHKQVYIHGSLDNRPTELSRTFGLTWGVGGWLPAPFLQKIGPAEIGGLRQLQETLQLPNIAIYNKRSTGENFLINQNKG